MKITQTSVVKLEYTLTQEGEVQPSQTQTVLMGHAHTLPSRLEPLLWGHMVGEVLELDLTLPVQASLKTSVPLETLPSGVQPGETLTGEDERGRPLAYRIVTLEGGEALLDANPEGAGREVRATVNLLAVREAEPVELEHGHVHGEGGVKHAH